MLWTEPALYGLLGQSLVHSYSPAMFAAVLSQTRPGSAYLPFETTSDGLSSMLAAMTRVKVRGFNVTVPFKEEVVRYLDDLAGDAREFEVVNCVVVEDGRLIGHNTDCDAFRATLEQEAIRPSTAVILGAGGAARAVFGALRTLGTRDVIVASRTRTRLSWFCEHGARILLLGEEELVEAVSSADLLINATPVGMHPYSAASVWTHGFASNQVVYDLIYNPRPSHLLKLATQAGCRTFDGLDMLARQATASLFIWTGARVSYRKFLAAACRIANPSAGPIGS